jgi:hypothetical protein
VCPWACASRTSWQPLRMTASTKVRSSNSDGRKDRNGFLQPKGAEQTGLEEGRQDGRSATQSGDKRKRSLAQLRRKANRSQTAGERSDRGKGEKRIFCQHDETTQRPCNVQRRLPAGREEQPDSRSYKFVSSKLLILNCHLTSNGAL